MKFIHIADIHFDMPFTVLNENGFADKRRLEQRNVFNKLIEYIKENNIECLFISGDLYENEYVRKSTIEYINNCFKKVPNTKIYITPGNHDPYINNSYYNKYEWAENVHIFTKLEKIKNNNINIYGYGFTDFYSPKVELPKNLEENKINILIMHADLNGANKDMGEYNSILESKLNETKFNYIALGHIHKTNFSKNKKIIYPGSLIAGGFDELGSHGMIVGNINELTKETFLEFVKLDDKEFIKINLDISNVNSKESLIEKINEIKIDKDKFYKIILVGIRNIQIDTIDILKYIKNRNIIKIKNETKIKYNLEEISKEQSLKGIFVNELLKQIEQDKLNKEKILKTIEIGLNAINNS